MKKLSLDFKFLIIVWCILILAMIPTFGHHGHLLIDSGREVYYPTQILLGKILYKDIFNIYGPFSYMFNALLFKLFGANLNVLYIAGCFCAFLISSLIYLIAKRFLSGFLSFSIAVFTIVIGVLNLNLFNFIFPYSYGMLYGISSFLLSVWLLLKYEQEPKNDLYLYLSSFFAGLCMSCKYEFLPYSIVVLYAFFKIKPLNFKQYYFSFFSLFFMPVFCFGILFLQGLRIQDLILTLLSIKKMMLSQTLKYFYLAQGIYFRKETPGLFLYDFFTTIVPLGLFTWGFKVRNKGLSLVLILASMLMMIYWINPASFIFFPLLILILAIINFTKIVNNTAVLILTFSAVTISLKVFWGLATLNYGAFFISFLSIVVIVLILESFKNINQINQTVLGIYFLFVALILGWHNLSFLPGKNYPVQSERGKIYSFNDLGPSTQKLVNYIDTNTKNSDTVVVFPEGPFINFMTGRKSDNYYNSLIPLYIETFSEEKIINHFKKNKPEYVIFNNWNTKDYYFKYICSDYALSFCEFVSQNYTQEKIIEDGFRYIIFKRK